MTSQRLLEANIQALREGIELLHLLDTEHYSSSFKPAFQATIGAHFRHVIEHYRCFVKQIAKRQFCYDQRERDDILESDSEYAHRSITAMIEQLTSLEPISFDREYQLVDQTCESPIPTTLQRELLFLHSHTVHHYAIIAAMARGFGIQPNSDFGVAIATIKYRIETNERSAGQPVEDQASDGSNVCAQ